MAKTMERDDKRRSAAESGEEPEARRQRTAASGSGLTPEQRAASQEADKKRQPEETAMDTDRGQGTVSGPGTERRDESQDVPMSALLSKERRSWKDGEMIMNMVLEQHREEYITSALETNTKEPVCEEPHFEWDADTDLPLDEDAAYYDDLSGKRLPEDLVQEARYEEIKFIDQIKLWNVVPRPGDGSKVIDTRWVDVNKGDENEPLVRARLVAKRNQEEGIIGGILCSYATVTRT